MDTQARRLRKVKLANLILAHAKIDEQFSVYDVQSWWIDEKMKCVPSIRELARDLPSLQLDREEPSNWYSPWTYSLRVDSTGIAIPPYTYTAPKYAE